MAKIVKIYQNEEKTYEPLPTIISLRGESGELLASPHIISRYLQIDPNGDFTIGDYSGGKGLLWDQSAGTFTLKGTLTASSFTLDTTGYIQGGQTAYNTGIGFFLGYSTDAYKFSIGDPNADNLIWDGTNLLISGSGFGQFVSDKITKIGDMGEMTNNDSAGTTTINYFITSFVAGSSSARASRYSDQSLDPSKDFSFTFIAKFNSTLYQNQTLFIGLHNDTSMTMTKDHTGIYVTHTSSYYSTGDGTTQQTTAITGITMGNYNVYKIVRVGASVKFYVGGVLKATHSTNIPTGTVALLMFDCENVLGGASNKQMSVYHNFVITNAL